MSDDEELASDKMQAWRKEKRPKIEMISAEQMEERLFGTNKDTDKTEKSRWRKYLTASNVVGVLAIAASVGFAIAGQNINRNYETLSAANLVQIEDLNEISQIDTQTLEQAQSTELIGATVDAVLQAAQEVADLQNAYAGMKISTVAKEGGGAEVVGAEELSANSDAIAAYFPTLDPSGVSGAWFTMWNQVDGTWVDAPVGSFVWQPSKLADMTGATTARVVWEAVDTETNELLAWAVGEWNNELGGFDELTLAMTSQGQAHQAWTDSGTLDGSDAEGEGN